MAETIESIISEGLFKLDFFDSDEEDPGKTLKIVINDEVGEVGSGVFKTTDKFPLFVIMRRAAVLPVKGHDLWVESKGWKKVQFGEDDAFSVTEGHPLRINKIPERLL